VLPYLTRMTEIADAYTAAPTFDATAVNGWRALAVDSTVRAAFIRTRLLVTETDAPEPYADAPAMFRDIARGRFIVSRANSEHPLWTVAENVAFRIVHDVLGHARSGGGFDWKGENRACALHFPLLSAQARPALFTECIAQTAYCNARGAFGPQKVARLTF
jgi:hypothetical protein